MESDDLDIGSSWATKEYAKQVFIYNTSNNVVTVDRIETSCNCSSVEPNTFTLPPSSRQAITLGLRLAYPFEMPATGKPRKIVVDLAAVLKNSSKIPTWRFTGTVQHPIVPEISRVTFNDPIISNHDRFRTRVISLECDERVADVTAICEPCFASVSLNSSPHDRQKRSLEIELSDYLPVGPFRFEIDFLVATSAGEKFYTTVLPVDGQIVDEFEIIPPQLRFGFSELGKTLSRSIVIRSRIGRSFRVSSADKLGNETSIDIDLSSHGTSHSALIKQLVSTVGQREKVVQLKLIPDGEIARSLPLQISYCGVSTK